MKPKRKSRRKNATAALEKEIRTIARDAFRVAFNRSVSEANRIMPKGGLVHVIRTYLSAMRGELLWCEKRSRWARLAAGKRP